MANTSKPQGLAPVQYLNGAPWNNGGRIYCIPDSDDSNAYAIGDPVTLAGSADGQGIPTITLATAGTGNSVLGAIVSGAGSPVFGGSYGVPADSPILIPAVKSRNYYVLVADDPNIVFQCQEDGLITPLAATDTGNNVNLVSGANNGYISGWQIDSDSKATTATLQLKLLGLAYPPRQPANAFGQYAQWFVLINNHCYRVGQAGV